MTTELDKFYALIEKIDVAMMTTRRADGHLRSRAMANQKRASGADLWFVTCEGSAKLADLAADPHVNLSLLPGRQLRMGLGVRDRHAFKRSPEDSRAVQRRIGRCGSTTMGTLAMGRPTIREWCCWG